MQQLKTKLFAAVGGTLSIDKFEKWLYSDPVIKNNIQTDDLIFQVVSLNYLDKNIKYELKKICFSFFRREDFLVDLVEQNCIVFSERLYHKGSESLFENICPHHSFDEDYFLIEQFYWLEDEWALAIDGVGHMHQVIKEINELVDLTLKSLVNATIEERLELLINGIKPIESNRIITQETVSMNPKSTKKWFEFWK
jgi:hypothetical protein